MTSTRKAPRPTEPAAKAARALPPRDGSGAPGVGVSSPHVDVPATEPEQVCDEGRKSTLTRVSVKPPNERRDEAPDPSAPRVIARFG
jgi:hypothetical protein